MRNVFARSGKESITYIFPSHGRIYKIKSVIFLVFFFFVFILFFFFFFFFFFFVCLFVVFFYRKQDDISFRLHSLMKCTALFSVKDKRKTLNVVKFLLRVKVSTWEPLYALCS